MSEIAKFLRNTDNTNNIAKPLSIDCVVCFKDRLLVAVRSTSGSLCQKEFKNKDVHDLFDYVVSLHKGIAEVIAGMSNGRLGGSGICLKLSQISDQPCCDHPSEDACQQCQELV